MQNKKGFTLLEILLVVGIIAILAGIVIIAINPGKQLATVRNTQRKNDLKQIYNAMTQFYIDKGQYPDPVNLSPIYLKEICNTGSVSNTATSTTGVACGPLVNLSALVPTYLTAIPVDPSGASSTMAFIPTAYAKSNGTGYRIMKTTSNQIVDQAPLAELGNQILLGTIPWTPTSGLLAHYKLNDTDGTTVVDSSGNGHDGSGSYSATIGKINGGVRMNGSTNSLNGGNVNDPGASDFSISVWMKTTVSQDGIMVSKFEDDGKGYYVSIGAGGGDYIAFYSAGSGCQLRDYHGYFGYNFLDGNWHNIIGVKSDGINELYVDGQVRGGTETYGPCSSAVDTVENTGNFVIGDSNSGGSNFNGSLDDVRIYSKALTSDEIQQIYNNGSGTESEIGSNLARIYYTPPSTKPTNVSVENVGDGSSLKVSFDLVPDATSYKVTCTDQWGYGSAGSATSDNSPVTVGGLNDGWPYNCVVKAINDGGSISSDPVGIYVGRAPSSPNYVSATAGYESATVSFMYPWDYGDDYNISYKITTIPETTTTVVDASYGYPGPPDWNTGIPVTLSGLTGGTTYTIVVTAMNSYGSGPSAYSNQVTPIAITIPDTIQNVSASAKDSSARVSWSPSNTLVSYYTVSSHSSQDATVHQETSANPSALVTGLINGDTYTFTVTASNYKGTSNPSSPSSSVVPQPFVFASSANLVAHYKMNDTDGSNVAEDSSGYSGSGSYTADSSGRIGRTLDFNGTSDYIHTGNNLGLPGGNFPMSVAMWIKTSDTGDQFLANIGRESNWWEVGRMGTAFGLYIGSGDGAVHFHSPYVDIVGLTVVNNGNWHHVVAAYDGVQTMNLYVDGNLETSQDVIDSYFGNPGLYLDYPYNDFYLGRMLADAWGPLFFHGSMDDVRVYDKELNLSEVHQIYNNGNGTETE